MSKNNKPNPFWSKPGNTIDLGRVGSGKSYAGGVPNEIIIQKLKDAGFSEKDIDRLRPHHDDKPKSFN